jgi:putative Mg2+ transporter-C (MgtC) family protein
VDWDPFIRVAVAAALALPVGLERELRDKPAGLRTHVVVSVASAAFGYLSIVTASGEGEDATRIAAQVVSGIGFLGAGVIFGAGGRPRGLTTAAGLWGASAIGLCAGMGAFNLAVSTTIILLVALAPLDWLADRLVAHVRQHERIFTVIVPDLEALDHVQQRVIQLQGEIRSMAITEVNGAVSARILIRGRKEQLEGIDEELRSLPQVRFAMANAVDAE